MTYTDTGVTAGTKYTYTVKALVKITSPNKELRSDPSNAVTCTPKNAAPASVFAYCVNSTTAAVDWDSHDLKPKRGKDYTIWINPDLK